MTAKTPITFSIPGNSSQYVSLRDYLSVECHMKETTDVQPNFMGDKPPRKRHHQDSIQSSAPKKSRERLMVRGMKTLLMMSMM